MRREISPMIAEASTAKDPKQSFKRAKTAEFFRRPHLDGFKMAARGEIFSRNGGVSATIGRTGRAAKQGEMQSEGE
jgi:hypothetical protein